MGDEKLFWNQHIHFIENSGKVPINLSRSISGTFMTLAWDLLHISRKKKNFKRTLLSRFYSFYLFFNLHCLQSPPQCWKIQLCPVTSPRRRTLLSLCSAEQEWRQSVLGCN